MVKHSSTMVLEYHSTRVSEYSSTSTTGLTHRQPGCCRIMISCEDSNRHHDGYAYATSACCWRAWPRHELTPCMSRARPPKQYAGAAWAIRQRAREQVHMYAWMEDRRIQSCVPQCSYFHTMHLPVLGVTVCESIGSPDSPECARARADYQGTRT